MLALLIEIPCPPTPLPPCSLASGTPASPTEERAGHKSGTTPARDCNPTGYTALNRVPACAHVCVRVCVCVYLERAGVYVPVAVREPPSRGMVSRASAMLLIDYFTRINEGEGRARAIKVVAAKEYDKSVVRRVAKRLINVPSLAPVSALLTGERVAAEVNGIEYNDSLSRCRARYVWFCQLSWPAI